MLGLITVVLCYIVNIFLIMGELMLNIGVMKDYGMSILYLCIMWKLLTAV
jgi:hypothetical protein